MNYIDLRSDTVTQPTAGMRDAMMAAPLGDDVFGDDPTVNALERTLAEELGQEAGLFLPTGTQSNLCGIMAHCGRGDEYIVGEFAHTYKYEAGGAAVLGSVQPQPIAMEPDGTLDLGRVARYIKPDDSHYARTQLLCIENTHGGLALPNDYHQQARDFADGHGLGLHLDGARLFNAAVFRGVGAREITKHYDSVSVCFSKGLGTPVGSVLVGRADLIERARRTRKMLGGGMRQSGILAAACLYALEHHVDRLADDHANARTLEASLIQAGIDVQTHAAQTNMVFVHMPDHDGMEAFFRERGILIKAGAKIRLVLHLDVTSEDLGEVVDCFVAYRNR
ncbi:MAG: low-specificity L-threonine aldolase [bacterium]